MTHRITLLFLLFSFLTLMTAGCDSTDDMTDQDYAPGQGGISVDGSDNSSFTGMAYWVDTVDEESGQPVFGIVIINASNLEDFEDIEMVVIAANHPRPSNGTHPMINYEDIEDGDPTGIGGIYMKPTADHTTTTVIISTSGSVTLNHSSSTQMLEGSFTFNGVVYDASTGQTGGTATVSGGFNAMFLNMDIPVAHREIIENNREFILESLRN